VHSTFTRPVCAVIDRESPSQSKSQAIVAVTGLILHNPEDRADVVLRDFEKRIGVEINLIRC
jgi:hypothetical protein